MAWVVSRLFGGDGGGGDNTAVPKEIHYDNDDVDHDDKGDDDDDDDSDDDRDNDDSDYTSILYLTHLHL